MLEAGMEVSKSVEAQNGRRMALRRRIRREIRGATAGLSGSAVCGEKSGSLTRPALETGLSSFTGEMPKALLEANLKIVGPLTNRG
jgi:hypothetical protein